jgi:hypothetical protein
MLKRHLSKTASAVLSSLAVAAFCAVSASAQAQQSPASPATTQTTQAIGAADNADLSITARVTARELRFEKVPNPTVEFTGRPRRYTVWESDRENLPAQVRPGETYRNIGITLRITSVFADIERIVAEALGEIPINEDAPTPTPQQPQTQQPPQTQQQPPSSPTPSKATSRTTQPRRPQPRAGRNK